MQPLISQQALRLGEIEDRAEIEALVERAWRVRPERFGPSVPARPDGAANTYPEIVRVDHR